MNLHPLPIRGLALLTSALFLAIFLCEPAHAQEASAASPQRITIRGVVINSVTREPVGRALVLSPDNRLAALADDQGRFEFTFPQPATDPAARSTEELTTASGIAQISTGFSLNYVLTARKPGFLSSESRSWTTYQSLALTGNDLTIPLVPEALIAGRVVLPSSNVADRIQVELYRRQVQEGRAYWIHSGSVITRSSGEFRFAELEPGTYKLLTREQMDRDPLIFDPRGPMYGYPPAYFPNATDFVTAGAIQLTPGVIFQAELSPQRQPYYAVKVPVTKAPPDAQITVNVSVQGRKGPGFALGYNDREQKIEGSLPNGTYVIEATSVGPNPATGSASLTVKGAALEGPALTLAPHSSVRINARLDFKTDPDPSPKPETMSQGDFRQAQWRRQNLSVRLEPADEFSQANVPQLRPPTGPHDDSLVFDGVAPGRYWVRIDSSRGFAASITSGDLDLLRRPLSVGLGSTLTIDLTMRDDGAQIDGSIEGVGSASAGTDDFPTPRPGSFIGGSSLGQTPVFVYCIPLADSTGQFRQALVSSDGKFGLQQVPPGGYRVLAFDRLQPELEYRNSEAMRAYDTKGQVVRLVTGQKENLRLQLISTSD